MDTWDSCWSRSGYSASYLRNIPSLHITHLIILRSLFQSWFAVKRHLIFAVWVGSGRSGFRRRNILIFTCKVPHATPSPKVQFPGVILNPNEAVLSCMDSNFALIFWIQCCRRYHRATQNPVLQRNPLSCMESSFALSCTLLAITIFFGLWSIPKVVICYAPSKNTMLWKTEFCHHVHQLLP